MADHTWFEGAAAPGGDGGSDGDAELLGGRYRLLGLVGRGGMGAVYRAWDTWLDEAVAVKVIRAAPDAPSRERLRRALVREVKLARRVSHPGVVRVHDLGRQDDQLFLVMELVPGRSLAHDLADHGPLPLPAAVEIARAVVEALRAAHRAGVVHNDLKPDNVLLGGDGHVWLADFGIARAVGEARTGVEGTPAYMAPEQHVAGVVDPRTDLYAFGRLFLAMLRGATPEHDDLRPTLESVQLPDPLGAALSACLFPVAGLRMGSFDELAAVLGLRIPEVPGSARARSQVLKPSDAVVVALRPTTDDPFVGGLAVEIADRLASVRGLATHRGDGDDADAVLTLAGPDPIRTRLVDRDGRLLWAGSEPADAVDADLPHAVAAAVATALGRAAPAATEERPSSEGYAVFLRARHALRHGWTADVSRAIGLLEVADARLPGDDRIGAALVLARVRAAFFDRHPTPPRLPALLDQAERLWARAPGRVDAWDARIRAELYLGHGPEAARLARAAVERFPGSSALQHVLATLLLEADLLPAALRRFEVARWLDPDSEALVPEYVYALALAGRRAEAEKLLDTPVQGHSARPLERLRLAVWDGRLDVEIPSLDQQPQVLAFVSGTLAVLRSGRVDAGGVAMGGAPLEVSVCPRFRASYGQRLIEVLARAGLVEEALGVLRRVAKEGVLADLAWVRRCPVLAELRGDPRFLAAAAVVAERAAAVAAALA